MKRGFENDLKTIKERKAPIFETDLKRIADYERENGNEWLAERIDANQCVICEMDLKMFPYRKLAPDIRFWNVLKAVKSGASITPPIINESGIGGVSIEFDGKNFVVTKIDVCNGRHRLALAGLLGLETMPIVLVKEEDGK